MRRGSNQCQAQSYTSQQQYLVSSGPQKTVHPRPRCTHFHRCMCICSDGRGGRLAHRNIIWYGTQTFLRMLVIYTSCMAKGNVTVTTTQKHFSASLRGTSCSYWNVQKNSMVIACFSGKCWVQWAVKCTCGWFLLFSTKKTEIVFFFYITDTDLEVHVGFSTFIN